VDDLITVLGMVTHVDVPRHNIGVTLGGYVTHSGIDRKTGEPWSKDEWEGDRTEFDAVRSAVEIAIRLPHRMQFQANWEAADAEIEAARRGDVEDAKVREAERKRHERARRRLKMPPLTFWEKARRLSGSWRVSSGRWRRGSWRSCRRTTGLTRALRQG
jgi:hypothetical protein